MALKSVTTGFRDSQEAALRRCTREAIKKAGFTKAERDVTLALVNHWFYHRNGKKGFIHPGREKIAKRADVSVKTVERCLAMLRGSKVLSVLKYGRGEGQQPTRYRLDLVALFEACGCDFPEFHPGILEPFLVRQMTHHLHPNHPQSGATKCRTVYNSVSSFPIQEDDTTFERPSFRVIEGGQG